MADTFNHTLRKVDPSGTVTTYAGGAGQPGSTDGVAAAVRFAYPAGISLDAYGNLYVADMDNGKIRLGALGIRPIVVPLPPLSTTALVGGTATFSVLATGPGPFNYQWRRDGVNITGATGATLVLSGLESSDAGFYNVIVGNASGAVSSAAAGLAVSVTPLEAVTFSTQPASQTVSLGSTAVFEVSAEGTAPLTYQWRKDGVALAGAVGGSLSLQAVRALDGGSYDVVVSNPVGSVASAPAKLTVDFGLFPASIVTQTTFQKVFPGAPAAFNVVAVGTPPFRYQWSKDGQPILGATGASYTIDSVQTADLGNYSVEVTGAVGGAASSGAAALSFDLTPPAGGSWSVLAGAAGGAGSLDATGAAAQFNYPRGLAVDGGSNLYVADTQNHTIRKITPAGVASTVAGIAGSRGSENGFALQAQFHSPQGVAIDAGSNLYVADTGNHVIRKISASGVVSTLAGAMGTPGALDATGIEARFNQPTRIALDAAGDLFVTDTGNHVIRKITAGGVVSTFAGASGLAGSTDETAANARFNSPSDLAFDAAGALYVADTGNKTIRKVTTGGTTSTPLGRAGFYGTNDGTGDVARFASPTALTSDPSGNLWVLDGNRLRAVSSLGVVTPLAGAFVAGANDGAGSSAQFFNPLAVCLAPSGDLYIADTGNSVLRVVGPGSTVRTFAGTASSGRLDGTATEARFHSPRGAAMDAAGNVYIADAGNHTIRKVTLSGVVTTLAGSGALGSLDGRGPEAQFNAPQAVAVDAAGNVYVADTGNHVLRVISPDGLVATLAGLAGARGGADGTGNTARFWQPRGLALDADGNIYVSDAGNFTLRKVTRSGVVSTFVGVAGVSGSADGTRAAARLSGPGALAFEAGGNLLFTDANAIRRVSPGGVVSTVAGRPGETGAFDGATALATFSAPQGLGVDASGTIFVADTFNHTIRQIGKDGMVSTVAGAAGATGSADGVGAAVRFAYPVGLCLDSFGNLVVTDLDNSKVRFGLLRETPLKFLSQPADATVFAGASLTLSVTASGVGSLSYQWRKGGVDLPGATSPEYTIPSVGADDAAGYTVVVSNVAGALTSGTALVSLSTLAPTPVSIASPPQNVVAAVGAAAVFTVTAEGSAPLRYQWRKNGTNILNATSPSYTITAATPQDAGSYDVLVFNSTSSRESAPVTLTVNDVGNAPPVIVRQPVNLVRYPGVPGTFTVAVTGAPPLRFQWRRAGVDIAGGTASTLLVDGTLATAAGSYDVVVSNNIGAPVTSSAATFSFTAAPPASGMWSVVAGATGGPGSQDGSALDARFSSPQGVALRSLGGSLYEVYLADTRNHTIRKISSEGEVTTFAGTAGVSGVLDGLGTLARFNAPQGVSLDAAGNVYVADTGNHLIRKITPDGRVSTLAGFPTYVGKADGQGSAARFNFPVSLASDANGSLYVADRENHAVRLVSPEGFVTTPAGYPGVPGYMDGSGLVARFNRPGGVALRSLGGGEYELFVADTGNKVIRKMTSAGVVTTAAGAAGFAGTTDGAAGVVRFGNPTGMACSSAGKVFIADGNRIRLLDPADGSVALYAGGLGAGRDDLSLTSSLFNGPTGLAVSAAGEVLVADTGNSTLRRIQPLTSTVETFAGAASAGSADGLGAAAQFRNPGAAVLDAAGNLYVADAGNHTIRKVTVSGVVTTLAGAPGVSGFLNGPGADARFSAPRGIALDASGNVYVADSGNHVLRVISPAGYVTTFAGTAGLPGSLDGIRETARFAMPRGLAFDAQGNLYVADTFNFSIRKITPAGVVTTLAGSPGAAGTVNGAGAAARFASPVALAADSAGNLYVADLHAIRKVTPAGLVSAFAGDPALSGSLDAQGPAAGFSSPQAVALDPVGNLYVADTGNQLIRRITPSGSVSTVAGSAGWAGSGEGLGSGVRFASPSGIATDALGNLYVVDAESARVRVGILAATPLAIVSEPANATTFLNRTTLLQVSATGPAPLSFQWSKDGLPLPDATAPVYRIAPTLASDAGTYSVTVTNPAGSVISRGAVLTVDGNVPTPVVINSQPAALSVVLGAAGSLSVTATGSEPLSYQWRKNGALLPGANARQLVFAAVSPGDAASYDVVVTNPDGPLTSDPALLTVTAPNPGAPLIGSQTVAQKVSPGAGATFSVTATGAGPFTYQWRKDGVDIPGATAADYTLPAVYAADAGLYQALVLSAGGTSTSTPAALSLNLVPPVSGLWSTLAGPAGGPGSLDSAELASAGFNYPRGMALDAAGTLYIADAGNHTIRRISAARVVSTVAGAPGVSGSGNGTASLARFHTPSGVAVDSAGNLYVADTGNHLIRKIDTTGEVTILAGTANKTGAQDGVGSAARFNGPQALVVTSSGTLYVADTGNSVIRRITSAGSVTTFAGNAGFVGHRDASSALAQFNKPTGLALDGAGTLYVADSGNKVVRKITADATVTTLAGAPNVGGTADGAAALARFTNPLAVASDAAGNLVVLDSSRVRSVSSAGLVVTLAGSSVAGFAEGSGTAAQFSNPLGVALAGSGAAYIADTGNSVLRQVDPFGAVTPFAGTASPGAVDSNQPYSVRFRSPRGLAQDAQGNTYVADSANHTIRKVANSGATTTLAGAFGVAGNVDGEASSARFNGPQSVALDASGNVYVADTGNHAVRLISTAGAVSTFAGSLGLSGRTDGLGSAARFLSPRGIVLDPQGNVYVADSGNLTIRKITPAGVVTTLAGTPGASGSLDGAGGSARFTAPVALALNASGKIVVADGSAIRAVSPFGNVTTLAGVAGVRGAADGIGANALFASPQGVALDAAGNVYVADTYNQTIRKVSATGAVTTLAGAVGLTGSAEGIGSVARFAYPGGILVDPLGNLCVTELDSAKVRIGALMDTSLLLQTQPVNASVLVGTPATFAVTAKGTAPFTYRWRKAGVEVSGAVGPVFLLPSAALGDAGLYDVVVEDAKESVTSGSALLSVYTSEQLAVAVNAQPVDATVLEGDFVRFSVDASSPLPLAYQWRKDGTPISGATSAALVLSSAVLADAGTYSVVASHAYSSATSAGAVLVVSAKPPVNLPLAIQSQPQSRSVTAGNPTAFSVTATGSGTLSYQWRKGGAALSGGTSAIFSIATVQTADEGSYDVLVSSSAGGSVSSSVATLTVSPAGPAGPVGAPSLTSQPFSVIRAAGEAVVFGVLANGEAPMGYQWRKNGVPIANANYLSYKILAVSAGDAGDYDVVVSNPRGAATSAVASLTVVPRAGTPPNILVQPESVTVSSGTQVNFSVGAEGNAPLSYQWYRNGSPLSGATQATLQLFSVQSSNGGNYSVRVSNPLGSVTSGIAVLNVGATVEEEIYTWSVFAGPRRGAPGSTDGLKDVALFSTPGATAMDKNGDVYVADTDNHTVRKITVAGVVSTLAGAAGCYGKADGTGVAARFSYPRGLAVDESGNVYVADTLNSTIRKITPSGLVTTFAGAAELSGETDAAGTAARFNKPHGIAVDREGNLYVADTENHTIRKVSPEGMVTTLAGRAGTKGGENGTALEARFSSPKGVAVAADGTVYVADTGFCTIRKIMPNGAVTTLAGASGSRGYSDGAGPEARFWEPTGIAVSGDGTVYVTDPEKNSIRRISALGEVSTYAGSAVTSNGTADGPGFSARFFRPHGLVVAGDGSLYVADSWNNLIRKIHAKGQVSKYAGVPPLSGVTGDVDGVGLSAKFWKPSGIAKDVNGNFYVSSGDVGSVIRKITSDGVATTLAGVSGFIGSGKDGIGADARFWGADGMAVDAIGNVYVADSGNNIIRKITAGGLVSTVAGLAGSSNRYQDGTGDVARFSNPSGIAIDSSGTLFVSDTDNHVIRRISPAGIVSTFAGAAGQTGQVDATGSAARFWSPLGIAVDADGTLYVADKTNSAIRKITADGVVTTLAGFSGGSRSSVDGTGLAARFNFPRAVALDGRKNLYVVDTSSNTIRKITPTGVVSTIGGMPSSSSGNAEGVGLLSRFSIPKGIVVDQTGAVFVTDSGNDRVIKGMPSRPLPTIIASPSPVTASFGSAVRFYAVATGGNLTFQWRKNGLSISGATMPVYSIPAVQPSDLGVYDVIIANGAGVITTAQAPLTLTTSVISPATITTQPRGMVVNLSSTLDLSVTATGTAPLTYQWRKDGAEIPGATASRYAIPTVILPSQGYYDVVVTNAAGSVLSEPALVEINGMGNVPPSILTQPASRQGVAGGFTTLTVAVAGSAPLSYQWRKGGTPIPGATSAAYTINGLRAADAGIYDVVVSNRADSVTSNTAVLTVGNPLAIVSQPVPLTVAAGNSAFFGVSASGTAPITYQWRKDGQPLVGGTASFYVVAAAQAADAGVYDVLVGNPGNSLTSIPAALNVQAGDGGRLVLLGQPANTGALAGGAASFLVSASGTAPLRYQWRRNGVEIAGANGPVYTVGAVQSGNVGSYDVVVANAFGEVTSSKASLGLYTPVSIISQPQPVSVATGTPAAFAVGATGTAPLSYQWRKDGQNIAGATQATYVIAAAQAADIGNYDVVLTNPAGSALSNAVALGVGAKPVLVQGPVGGSVLAGGTFALSASATGEGVTYQWRKNGLNISGATGPVLTLRKAAATDAGRFEVVVANAYGAVAPVPSAEVVVHVPVGFVRQPAGALLREGGSTTLSVEATGSGPLSYQWRRDGVAVPGATRFSYTVANASAANAGAYDVVVNNPAGAVASNVAQVSVSVALGIVRQPSGAVVTQGSAVGLSVLAKGSGEIGYKWYKWSPTGAGVVVGTLSTLSFPGATPTQAGTYSVLLTGNGAPVFSERVVLAVSTARGVAVLVQPRDEAFSEGAAVTVRTVIDGGGGEARQTRYTLCALQNGALVATGVTGVVPGNGILEVPLRQLKTSGAHVVQFERVYEDGGAATALTQPFYLTVRGKTEAVGTYEGLLLDANPAGLLADGAVARGWMTLSVSRTGSVSGRVQYVEAGSLAGAPSEKLRVYQPVVRSFSGVLAPSAEDPLKLVATLRLGVGTQAGRQELALLLDQSSETPLLTATLTDRVSLPSPAGSVSKATGLRRTLATTGGIPSAYAAAEGRYTLSAPAAGSASGDNNAQLLVQVLPSGRALWASRLTGYSGSGSAGLTAPSATLLLAALYEGRSSVGSTLLTTSALLGELRWALTLDGGWELGLSGGRLEQARSKVAGGRVSGGFAGAYAPAEFANGTNLTGVRVLEFGGASDCRIYGTLLGTLFGAGAPGLTFVSADPLAGGSLGFSWNVTVSSNGVVRTAGIVAGGVTPPVLSLRLDKTRGEWSGSYVTGGVRRSLIGCVLDLPESRGRGWFESGTTAGRWELRLGP